MSSKKQTPIRDALTMASYTLLTTAPCVSQASGNQFLEIDPWQSDSGSSWYGDPWKIDSAVLFYAERNRVKVLEPVIAGRKAIGDDEYLNLKLVGDTMTGATPNGATATDRTQTFTTASGNSNYSAAPNETPLRHFSDSRLSLSADWEKPYSRTFRSVWGASFSRETDYTSMGLSSTLSWDFNNKLTTLSTGLSGSFDFVQPSGGAPEGLALTPKFLSFNSPTSANLTQTITAASGGQSANAVSSGENSGGEGSGVGLFGGKSKILADAMIGITQVVNRRTLMQLNYGFGRSSGYLTDPYKIVSVVDGVSGETVAYRYEQRPGTRIRQTVYWKTVVHLPEDIVHFSYRYYWDDWGIRSNTFDLQYRLELWHGNYLSPHFRYYTQTAADFYNFSLIQGEPLPTYISADYRLAAMISKTVGLKYGIPLGKDGEFSIRGEYMWQTGDSHPADAIGIQKTENLYPGLQAYIFQLGYSYKF